MLFADFSKAPVVPTDPSKRAVFKRLGDDVSQYSVTSTTAFEDDDHSNSAKKLKEDTAKLSQEKVQNVTLNSFHRQFARTVALNVIRLQNSVFQRLGQKCDVSSTSVDAVIVEEKKPIVSTEIVEIAKPSTFIAKGKTYLMECCFASNRATKGVQDVESL